MPLGRFLKQQIRRFLQRRGYELYRRPWLPKGIDPWETLRATWPEWQPATIFDVGANIGQTAERLRAVFPSAQIHAFEPVPATHAVLQAAVKALPGVHPHCLALADRTGELWLAPQSDSTLNSLQFLRTDAQHEGIRVTLQTTGEFCAERGITHIDLLKIDVEGAELSVLRGANALLAAGAVDFVLVEAGLRTGKSRFTPLPALMDYLQPHGYWLVGIYEQHGWHHFHAAEFCNALFALEKHLTTGAPTTASSK